jgi:hypothetical protein
MKSMRRIRLAAAVGLTIAGAAIVLSPAASAAPASGGTFTTTVVCTSRVDADTWFNVSADVTVTTDNSFEQIDSVGNLNGYLSGVTAFEALTFFNGGSASISADGQSVTISGAGVMTSYLGLQEIPVLTTPTSCTQAFPIASLK